MILQLMIRRPDKDLEESLLISFRKTEEDCKSYCLTLQEGFVPLELLKVCLHFLPCGFYLEGVAYGEDEDDILFGLDLELKVLH